MTDGAVFQGRKRNLSQHKQIRKALGLNAQNFSEGSEDGSLQLFDNCSFLNDMPLAFCIIELVFDADGHGVDFVFRYCNDEMTVVEGVPVSEMLNRSFYEVFENGDKKWLVTYADVALNGNKHILHDYSPEIDKTLTIYCFQPAPGYCACVLIPSQLSAIWRMRLQNYFSVNKAGCDFKMYSLHPEITASDMQFFKTSYSSKAFLFIILQLPIQSTKVQSCPSVIS